MTTTTDQSALLTAVRANLADDAPRLIYADWLDEHGEPDRAEFIRVQCEFAPITSEQILAWDRQLGKRAWLSRVGSLRRRERELLESFWIDDENEIRSILSGARNDGTADLGLIGNKFGIRLAFDAGIRWQEHWFEYRRGFLSTITTTMAIWAGETCRMCHTARQSLETFQQLFGRGPLCVDCGGRSLEGNVQPGTGRVNAHGPAIVRAECAAVERVEFSDKRPAILSHPLTHELVRGHAGWRTEDHEIFEDSLPPDVWELLDGWQEDDPPTDRSGWKWYDSEADALAALSRAAIELESK